MTRMTKDKSQNMPLSVSRPRVDALKLPMMTRAASSQVTLFDRWLVHQLLKVTSNPPISIELWNGEEITPHNERAVARLKIRNRQTVYKLIIDPETTFGDLYSGGEVEVEGDLIRFLETVYCAYKRYNEKPVCASRLRGHRPQPDTLTRSRDNIHHHYDLGNDFYELWLDRAAKQYTCAYFSEPGMSLEDAQIAKMRHICRKLRLTPGQTVVEAGSGWGELALFMAHHYGVAVKAYNISREQVTYARERAAKKGLTDKVEYINDDYRHISGKYDVFVSVGMLEHVGRDHYVELGRMVDRCLTDNGYGLIHSIGRNKAEPLNAWIEKRIFPGAYPPTLREMMDVFEPFAFSVMDVENLRLHYAKTLEHWLARFELYRDLVRQKYGEPFVRAWRLYLAGSVAAFTTGDLQLFQVVFTRPRDNELPWSRTYMYPN